MPKRLNIRKTVLAIAVIVFGATIALAAWIIMRSDRDPPPSLRVGVFLFMQHPVINEIYEGFKTELDKHAAEQGVTLQYVMRNADGDAVQSTAIANFFKNEDVDLVFVVGLPAAQSLKSAQVPCPVVFGGPPDPVAAGLVPQLKNHGTNFTGTRYFPLVDKALEVFKKAFPQADRIAVLHNPGEANSATVVKQFLIAAKDQNFVIHDLAASNAAEIEVALRALDPKNSDGLFLPTDNLVYSSLDRILSRAKELNMPVFSCTQLSVEKGAAFSLAVDYNRVGEITAEKVAVPLLFEGKIPQNIDVVEIKEGYLYVNSQQGSGKQFGPVANHKTVYVP